MLDVRTPEERAKAKLDFARLLDQDAVQWLEGLDKDETLVFMCRSGNRSQTAAQAFIERGFKKVYNLSGGILAWSREVDSSVPTY